MPRAFRCTHLVSGRHEGLRQHIARLQSCRWPEALVAMQVRVESFRHGGIRRMWRRPTLAAVVGERRVERGAPADDRTYTTFDPFGGGEVEECRRGSEVGLR